MCSENGRNGRKRGANGSCLLVSPIGRATMFRPGGACTFTYALRRDRDAAPCPLRPACQNGKPRRGSLSDVGYFAVSPFRRPVGRACQQHAVPTCLATIRPSGAVYAFYSIPRKGPRSKVPLSHVTPCLLGGGTVGTRDAGLRLSRWGVRCSTFFGDDAAVQSAVQSVAKPIRRIGRKLHTV